MSSKTSERSEMELERWDAMRAGDSEALAWLYAEYFSALYNYGRKIGATDAALQDGIHDLFVDLWRMRETLSPTTSVRFYLYRSLRRRLVRNDTSPVFITADGIVVNDASQLATPSREENLIEEEKRDQRLTTLRKLLNNLTPRQYEALVLRFYDELSFEEIGAILGVNEQSARNLVQRGLAQMKQYARYVMALFVVFFV